MIDAKTARERSLSSYAYNNSRHLENAKFIVENDIKGLIEDATRNGDFYADYISVDAATSNHIHGILTELGYHVHATQTVRNFFEINIKW